MFRNTPENKRMSIDVIKYEPDTLPEFPFEFMRAKGTNRTPQFLHWHEYLELDLSAFKKHCGKTPSQYRSDAATI